MKHFFRVLLLLLFSMGLLACNESDNNQKFYPAAKEVQTVDTVSVETIRGYYESFLKTIPGFSSAEIRSELSKIKYDVIFSVVEYEVSDPFGKTKTLSGLVGYPVLPVSKTEKMQPKFRIASFQHGTIALESQAPTKIALEGDNRQMGILPLVVPAHENGYVIVMPDYFGYGNDEKNSHYYEHRSSLAGASRSLIEDLPGYLNRKGIRVDFDNLFLFGYSEGGFATMSTLKSFSEATNSQFKNFTTIAGAGAYDKVSTALDVVQRTTPNPPSFICSYIWVLLTYNSVYKINRELDQMFQSGVVPEIRRYVGNDSIMSNHTLPTEPVNVFNANFVKELVAGTDTLFMKTLVDNNVSDFDAKGKLTLIHGDADTYVPTFNTDSAFVRLQKRGVDVQKIIVPNGTHSTTYPFFMLEVAKHL